MGLLDDAIREHMELKRLRGGDPAVIARQEQDALGPEPQPDHDPDFANVGQETAELDMRTVLEIEGEREAGATSSHLESAGLTAGPAEEGGAVEDVLEETPDFLRDTPEQERLWFEQQPPRDFDFDK